MGMKFLEVTIEGDTPIMMDRMTEEDAEGIKNSTSSGAKKGDEKKKEDRAKEHAYLMKFEGEDDVFFAPHQWLLGTIQGGMKFCKIGRKSASNFTGAIHVPHEQYPIMRGSKPLTWEDARVHWEHHNAHSGPQTYKRFKARAVIPTPWVLTFKVGYHDKYLKESNVKEFIEDAGVLSGIGTFAPRHKGSYGKFRMVSCKVVQKCDSIAS